MKTQTSKIVDLFRCTSELCRINVETLVTETETQLVNIDSQQLMNQWLELSQKLNNQSKLTCLSDSNHRLMLIQFIRAGAVKVYKSSYYNRAKIEQEYLTHLKQIGPELFVQVMRIVNKLNIVYKHYKNAIDLEEEESCQSHIKIRIAEILKSCGSKKREINNNLNKFKSIVEFDDRIQLIKELGKMLRNSWTTQKKNIKYGHVSNIDHQPQIVCESDNQTVKIDSQQAKQLQIISLSSSKRCPSKNNSSLELAKGFRQIDFSYNYSQQMDFPFFTGEDVNNQFLGLTF